MNRSLVAMLKTPTKTPVKDVSRLSLTPTSQSSCIVCGKLEDRPRYRRKLFVGNSRTNVCLEIEDNLDLTIPFEVGYACIECIGQMRTATSKIEKLRKKCELNLVSIKEKYMKTSSLAAG